MRGLITQRQIKDEYNTDCDRLEKDYVEFFEELGFEIISIENRSDKIYVRTSNKEIKELLKKLQKKEACT